MKKTGVLLSVLIAVALIATASAEAETVLTLKLEADLMGAGTEYDVRVYALVEGTDNDEGLADVSFNIYSSTSTGLTDSVEKFPPPNSGKSKITWDTAIAMAFSTFDPSYVDIGSDGDMDARAAAFSDMQDYTNLTVALGGWTLLATERWVMNADQEAWLEIEIDPISRHFDWDVPSPYKTGFDSVVGIGATVGIPEPATMSLLVLGGLGVLVRRRKVA